MKTKFTLLLAVILTVLFFSLTLKDANAGPRGTFVVPSNYTAVAGGGSFLGPLSNAARTYQMLIRDTLLLDIVGQKITALTFRLLPSASANWPVSDVNISDFDIYLSESVAPENRSLTFASNVVGVQKKVRSGPLTILAGSFPFGGSPTAFGTDITFDSGYTYTGGHLLIELRHPAFSGTAASTDAILASGGPGNGYGFLFSSCWQSSFTATTGIQANFCIAKLNTETLVNVIDPVVTPNKFSLSQNYPNPFNPSTSISFELPQSSFVSVKIYNAAGREVTRLVSDNLISGTHNYTWDASSFTSGVYFYKMEARSSNGEYFSQTNKMLLIK